MWGMTQHSIALFFRGKLFAEKAKVYRQLLIGVLVTAAVLVAAAKLGAPIWLAAPTAALIGGILQPYLFRNLRYL